MKSFWYNPKTVLNEFLEACKRGHLSAVKRLLKIPEVKDNVTAFDNQALREARELVALGCYSPAWDSCSFANADTWYNEALREAARNGRNKTFIGYENPKVLANAAACKNEALRSAAKWSF